MFGSCFVICPGRYICILLIENVKKADLVTQLVTRGYESDPMKAWKASQDKQAVLAEGEEETEGEGV